MCIDGARRVSLKSDACDEDREALVCTCASQATAASATAEVAVAEELIVASLLLVSAACALERSMIVDASDALRCLTRGSGVDALEATGVDKPVAAAAAAAAAADDVLYGKSTIESAPGDARPLLIAAIVTAVVEVAAANDVAVGEGSVCDREEAVLWRTGLGGEARRERGREA